MTIKGSPKEALCQFYVQQVEATEKQEVTKKTVDPLLLKVEFDIWTWDHRLVVRLESE